MFTGDLLVLTNMSIPSNSTEIILKRLTRPQLKYYVFAVMRHFCFVLGRQAGSEIFVIQLQKYNTYTILKRKQRKKIRTFYFNRTKREFRGGSRIWRQGTGVNFGRSITRASRFKGDPGVLPLIFFGQVNVKSCILGYPMIKFVII